MFKFAAATQRAVAAVARLVFLNKSLSMIKGLEGQIRDLEENIEARESEEARLRYELDIARNHGEADETIHRTETLDHSTRNDLVAVLEDRATPQQALSVIRELFPGRVVILPSAWKASKQSESFKHHEQLLSLLWKPVTAYRQGLLDGNGDTDARAVFGNAFAAKESETVESNAAARKRRTFDYQGKPMPMMKHLKIGVKESAAETVRIHFGWDAKEQRIVIGHCGPHLDFD